MIPPEVLEVLSHLTLPQKQELTQWLKEEIQQEKLAQRQARRSLQPRLVVEQQHRDSVTFQLELVDCRNQRCQKCGNGPSHGPYWYAYTWNQKLKKMVSRYIGKRLPTQINEGEALE
jgi:rubrerythrin